MPCSRYPRIAPASPYHPRGWALAMAAPEPEAPVGWPARVLGQLDAGTPLEEDADYRQLLDLQAAAPAGELSADVAALNAGVAAPAARVLLLPDGASQQLPHMIESCFAPMLELRRSVLLFEPAQAPEVRQARKRQRGSNPYPDGVAYDGNSYCGRCGGCAPSACPLARAPCIEECGNRHWCIPLAWAALLLLPGTTSCPPAGLRRPSLPSAPPR